MIILNETQTPSVNWGQNYEPELLVFPFFSYPIISLVNRTFKNFVAVGNLTTGFLVPFPTWKLPQLENELNDYKYLGF